MKKTILSITSLVALAGILFTVGCGSSVHPNQINPFDGDTYDTLTTARAALVATKSRVQAQYPKYVVLTNTAIASYNTAYASYVTFRQAPAASDIQLASQIGLVTAAVIELESQLQADLKPSAEAIQKANAKYASLKDQYPAHTIAAHISLASILTELEIAAAVAQSIPIASPYAQLAQLVIEATSQAVAAVQASSGKPIDLSLIGPVSLIPIP